MKITIMAFGRLAELINSGAVDIGQVSDTDQFKAYLEGRYPALIGANYSLTLNRKLIQENTRLDEHSEIAVMPPFSGG